MQAAQNKLSSSLFIKYYEPESVFPQFCCRLSGQTSDMAWSGYGFGYGLDQTLPDLINPKFFKGILIFTTKYVSKLSKFCHRLLIVRNVAGPLQDCMHTRQLEKALIYMIQK